MQNTRYKIEVAADAAIKDALRAMLDVGCWTLEEGCARSARSKLGIRDEELGMEEPAARII